MNVILLYLILPLLMNVSETCGSDAAGQRAVVSDYRS
jgi:hypothetical protein